MNALRVFLLAVMLVPVVAVLAPTSSASACYPNHGPIAELEPVWSAAYSACTNVFDRVNKTCHSCLG